jgi:hypothetical protein
MEQVILRKNKRNSNRLNLKSAIFSLKSLKSNDVSTNSLLESNRHPVRANNTTLENSQS